MLLPLKTSHQFGGKEGKAGIWGNGKHLFSDISHVPLFSPLFPFVRIEPKGQSNVEESTGLPIQAALAAVPSISSEIFLCDFIGPQGLHW